MKRFLHVLGILIGGILIALVILGLVVDRVEITSSLFVAAPVDETWTTFMDDERMAEWLPNFQSAELVSGTPNTVGSQYEISSTDGETWTETITAITFEEQFAFDMVAGPLTGSVTVDFEPREAGTFLTQTTILEGSSFVWRALLPVFKPFAQNEQAHALDMLGDLVESDPSPVLVAPIPAATVPETPEELLRSPEASDNGEQ